MCLGVSCEVRKNKVKNHSAAKRQFENKTGAKTVLSVVVVVVGQSINKTKSKRSNGRVCWGWMDDCFSVCCKCAYLKQLHTNDGEHEL